MEASARVVAIDITEETVGSSCSSKSQYQNNLVHRLRSFAGGDDPRKLLHCAKVGIALVLVSLLYLIEPLHEQMGDNAMWAIMTVVVMFEYTAGATLSKGLNRGLGTVVGGILGMLVGIVAQKTDRKGSASCIGVLVFLVGAIATYIRLIPKIKKKYDYGLVVFLLTFNLVSVSGHRAENIIQLASERLAMIAMGFGITIMISLIIFPISAGNDFRKSMVSKFKAISGSLEECVEGFFKEDDEKATTRERSISKKHISVMHSKSADETTANFAKWEPWHGRIGTSYPWNKYIKIGDILRQMAASIHTLHSCLESQRQPPHNIRIIFKDSSKALVTAISFTMRELAESIEKSRKCQTRELINGKLRLAEMLVSAAIEEYKKFLVLENEGCDKSTIDISILPVSTLSFVLLGMVEKVEELAKEVVELGDLAGFHEA